MMEEDILKNVFMFFGPNNENNIGSLSVSLYGQFFKISWICINISSSEIRGQYKLCAYFYLLHVFFYHIKCI